MLKFAPVVIVALALLITPALAEDSRVVVSPNVNLLRAFADKPLPMIQKSIVNEDGFLGSLRFARELTAEEIATVEGLGVVFSRPGDRVRSVGPIYPARIRFENLEQILQFPGLLQVDTDFLFKPQPYLDTTRKLTGSTDLTWQIGLESGQLPGMGVKVMDLDDGIDPFHPSFFHADGGYYRWLDVDEDGELTFGTDACDLNANGIADPEETLSFIDTSFVEVRGDEWWKEVELNEEFDVGVDWIFADTNGNGLRDYGPEWEYYDDTPGFGEPMLLLDDVNGNGKADLNEKMVLLGHSKLAKVRVAGEEYIAGNNLAELDTDVFGAQEGMPGGYHGTGVCGIMVAGNPGLTRFVGMAPYATLYVSEYSSGQQQNSSGLDAIIDKLAWGKEQGVEIIVMPIGVTGVSFMDGSTNFELAMDKLYVEDGILMVVAAGNEGAGGKHLQAELPPGESAVTMTLPDELPDHPGYPYGAMVIYFSVYWSGEEGDIQLSITPPGFDTPVLLEDNKQKPTFIEGTDLAVYCGTEKSFSGGVYKLCSFFNHKWEWMDNGDYIWTMTNTTEEPKLMHAFASDWFSSTKSLLFDKWVTSDSTMSMPATANSAISVAAYAGRVGEPEGLGKLRNYSSRGPRIDGELAMEVAGPDDPWVPLSTVGNPDGSPWGNLPGKVPHLLGSYMPFGGTSGASPHVAGSLVLLRQHNQEATAQQLYNLLTESARTEEYMGDLPNKEWGFGKIDVYHAAMGQPAKDNDPPTAVAALSQRKGMVAVLDSSGSFDPEGSALEYRWDFDYDGTYNMPWVTEPALEYEFPETGLVTVKLVVRDPMGATDEALLTFDVADDFVSPEPVVESATEGDLMARNDATDDLAGSDAHGGDAGPATPPTEDGCGCQVNGHGPLPAGILLLLAMVLMLLGCLRFRGSIRVP